RNRPRHHELHDGNSDNGSKPQIGHPTQVPTSVITRRLHLQRRNRHAMRQNSHRPFRRHLDTSRHAARHASDSRATRPLQPLQRRCTDREWQGQTIPLSQCAECFPQRM
ncbi:hypothetical protein LTR28_009650, partial [Elasticomyces elasticus]